MVAILSKEVELSPNNFVEAGSLLIPANFHLLHGSQQDNVVLENEIGHWQAN